MTRLAMIESNMSGTGFQALRLARELGAEFVFVTRDLSLYEAVPGVADLFRHHVSHYITCETNDEDALAAAIKAENADRPLDGIVTFGEYHVAVTSAVARRLGFPGPDPEAVRIARNKDRTRTVCAAAGIPMPRYSVVSDPEEAVRSADALEYPCVVKPADESGSIDVAICFDAAGVRQHAQVIKAAPLNYRSQRRSPLILVEEYLVGPEVSVETISHGGRTHVVGVTDKRLSGLPFFVEMGHAFPSALPEEAVTACARTATRALDAIGYDLGPAHVEVKLTVDGPRLIEINTRTAGDRIPDLIELSTGLSMARETLRMAHDQPPDLSQDRRCAAAIRFGAAEPGTVRRILGVELARNIPGVVDVGLETTPGRSVKRLSDAHDRVCYVIASGETTYQACLAAETALSQIIVDTGEGAGWLTTE